MPRSAAYWQARRQKAGNNFVKNSLRTVSNASVGNIARLAWSGVKGIRALINAEKHFVDAATSGTISYSTGSVLDFTQIAVGDTQSTRTGNSLLVNNITARIKYSKSASATASMMRVMLVLDNQQVADTPVTAASILNSVSPISTMNRANLGRYKVLYSKKFILDANKPSQMVNIFKRFKRHHFRYNGTAVSDIQKGGLYLVTVHDEPTNIPTIDVNYSTAFYDN